MKRLVTICVLCLLFGCSKQAITPNAVRLSDKDASFIESLASTTINSVDGVPISNGLKLGKLEPQNVVKLPPGRHVLMINYSDERGSIRGDVRLDVTLQSGKRYWLAPISATLTMKEGDSVGFTIKPMYAGAQSDVSSTLASSNSPVGTWEAVDDETGKIKSIMQITEINGELRAKMLQVLQSDEGPHPLCSKCKGSRRNQPVEGMIVMWGVRHDHNLWDGGNIIDLHSGKVYKVNLQTTEGGTKLMVHGYIGFSLNGRSQLWLRKN